MIGHRNREKGIHRLPRGGRELRDAEEALKDETAERLATEREARMAADEQDSAEQAQATFTPYPPAITGPFPSAARPYAPQSAGPYKVRHLNVPVKVFDELAGHDSPFALLPCTAPRPGDPDGPEFALCGATFDSGEATEWDRMLLVAKNAAVDAGWGWDAFGRWCCPACLPPLRPPVLRGGLEAEVDLRVRILVNAGRYEDMAAVEAEIAAREERIRIAEDAAAELEGRLPVTECAP